MKKPIEVDLEPELEEELDSEIDELVASYQIKQNQIDKEAIRNAIASFPRNEREA